MVKVINTKINSAQENMRIDSELLESLDTPTLHLYDWKENSITYGCFIDPNDFFHMNEVEKNSLDIAKRPTGGGIVFHMWDLAFSFLLPSSHPKYPNNVLDSYHLIHGIVASAIGEFYQGVFEKNECLEYASEDKGSMHHRFCMAHPSKYDLMIGDKKVAGAAQRRTKKGFLHQGSIFLLSPEKQLLESILLQGEDVFCEMTKSSLPLLVDGDLGIAREKLQNLLAKAFQKIF